MARIRTSLWPQILRRSRGRSIPRRRSKTRCATSSILAVRPSTGALARGSPSSQGEEIIDAGGTDAAVLRASTRCSTRVDRGRVSPRSRGRETFYADDLVTDARWPTFGPLAASRRHAQPVVVLPVRRDHPRRAQPLRTRTRQRSTRPIAPRARSSPRTPAWRWPRPVNSRTPTRRWRSSRPRTRSTCRAALASRQVIGRAEGILMHRERITCDQAFDLLREASQHLNTKLREVAQYVVDTGEIPGSPSTPTASPASTCCRSSRESLSATACSQRVIAAVTSP